MIEITNLTMEYRIQRENIKSIKEYIVNLLQGKVNYNYFKAVNDISFTIEKGEVCGIIGKNGAGKSTLLKIISGVIPPTSGSIKINGKIAPLLELGAGFDNDLTARENIYLNGAVLGYNKKFLDEKYDEIVEFSELKDFMDQQVRTFSTGMMMRLAFSIATLVEPEILIVDEILSVGDAHFSNKSINKMKNMMSGGTTVLMVSHSLKQIKELCNRVIWIEKGKIKMDGNPLEVCEQYENELK
ncbi:MAG: ABC transporter ATP-binding protein [Peptoanaerobacter stomatis]|uniref:ABC transporter ATP-binding protein n=1 Tax=Peptoanaerobacter stomatis TaxID=796937 RepID=UPI003F9F658B